MIKLAQYIPEIKVQPKDRKIQLDDIWTFYNGDDEVIFQIIDILKDDLHNPYVIYNIFVNDKFSTTIKVNYNKFVQKLKEFNAKLDKNKFLEEIKIKPSGIPQNNKELRKYISRYYNEFKILLNRKLEGSRYYGAYKLPELYDLEDDIILSNVYDNKDREIVDMILVWTTSVHEQSGNLYLSLFEDDLDYIGFVEFKQIKIYYDISMI